MKLSIGLIMPLIVIFSITSCKKDLTPAPTSSADTNIANNFSSTVFNSGVKRAVAPTINYIGFITSFASTSYVVTNKINLTGAHNITISGKNISGGQAPAITLNNCYNIHITQNKLGNSSDVGIALYNCKNITIDYNYISNVSCGVYVENVTEGGITVINNQFKNIKGPSPRGQFVQFNTVSGPNNNISYNACENIAGYSNPQDAINLFMSNGTAASPIKVLGNWIRGGGPSTVGGGIMLGDYGGSYQVAYNNTLVDPGQYGIAIAGGDHMTVTGNTIFAKAQSFTNVGLYVWGQEGYKVTNCTISYNKVKFFNSANQENDSWLASGTITPTGWSTNTFGAAINTSILPTVITYF